ncbi:MAG: hypothetical protein A2516_04290 [Alphaproteobacteria bacterium RIFOXYD12_FULL_60_8]|nr:MAG: hypothetical protein A2516_04290 [Alphaproteobacteria bacterium RIFOXYD12_FULL_60_8]
MTKRYPAKRDEVVYLLRRHAPELERFGLISLSLFGSVARNQSTRDSDVDLIAEFAPGKPDGLFEFVELKGYLSNIVGRPVDLITLSTIKPRLKAHILKEAIRVI